MITTHTRETLIAFERCIAEHFGAGELPCLIHLSGGNEDQLLRLFEDVRPQDWVFSSHRNHLHALLKGIPPDKLEADILAGRSMFIYSAAHRFVTSAILAGTCGIAAGVAWDIKARGEDAHVWCFLGDGAAENGHAWEAITFAEGHGLPITFVIEDNDRQVDTDKATRRGPHGAALDRALDTFRCVHRYTYSPTYPHGGAGLPAGSVTFKPEAIARLRAQT